MSLAPAPGRLALLAAVAAGEVYTEASAVWRRPDEVRVTGRAVELALAGWVKPLRLEPAGPKRLVALEPLGEAVLAVAPAVALCRDCGALIARAVTPAPACRRTAVDVVPVIGGGVVLDMSVSPYVAYLDAGRGTHTNHAETCAKRSEVTGEAVTCRVCGRELTTGASRASGLGPKCARRLDGAKPARRRRARLAPGSEPLFELDEGSTAK